jgi:NitT/TauT family transport system ATP-binding protein
MVAALVDDELPLLRVSRLTLAHTGSTKGARPVDVLRDVSFDLERGEVLAVVGPSGAGKSTLLAALAGLLRPRAGVVMTQHGPLSAPTSRHAIVFQDGALFPWLTLEQNVLFALRRRGGARAWRREKARDLLRRVRLSGHEAKFPHELSGGMKKRGAFARALATEPEVLLLDEPFSALDVTTRAELHEELLALFSARGVGIVLVTHDLAEAATLADRVAVLDGSPGRIVHEIAIMAPRPRHTDDVAVEAARADLAHALERRTDASREEERDETHAARSGRALGLVARVVGAR